MVPLNELEQLMCNRQFGPKYFPEFFRLLRESDIFFLLPHHPEVEGEFQIQNGDTFPPLVVLESPEDGRRVLIFSSLERANELCEKLVASGQKYAICEMPGKQLFELLSCQPDAVALNTGCDAPTILLDQEAIRQISQRQTVEPASSSEAQTTVQLIAPADYPTNLVNGIFQLLRDQKNVQAAWLAKESNRTEPGAGYIILLAAIGDRTKLQEDILLVAGAGLPKDAICRISFLEAADMNAISKTEFPPFYAAPDFKGPDLLK